MVLGVWYVEGDELDVCEFEYLEIFDVVVEDCGV